MQSAVRCLWYRVRFPLTLAAIVAGLNFLAGAGTAEAGSWALVNSDGTLSEFKGVKANFKDGTGIYRIVFTRSVTRCALLATPEAQPVFTVLTKTGNPGEVEI